MSSPTITVAEDLVAEDLVAEDLVAELMVSIARTYAAERDD